MNINILNPLIDSEYIDLLAANGFVSIMNDPTRGDSCLDHVFIRDPVTFGESEYKTELVLPGITDHMGVSATITFPRTNNIKGSKNNRKTIHKLDHPLLYRKIP
jgi:hypothetical protein